MGSRGQKTEDELLKEQPWYRPGKWYVSPMTWLPEVRATMPDLPQRVHVVDPTLREAEDNVAVSFTVDQKMEIARRLSDVGVEAIDCGYVGNPGHEETMARIASSGVLKKETDLYLNQMIMNVSTQLDDLKRGADRVVELGGSSLTALCIGPVESREKQNQFVEYVRYVGESHPGLKLVPAFALASGGFQFIGRLPTMRASFEWQVELSRIITQAGVERICVADSMGCASPAAWKYIAAQFRKAIGPNKSLGVHNHNDYGLAAANAIAGVEGGADCVEVVSCGLGARAGNAALEEVVLGLEALYGIPTGIKVEKLFDLATFIQEVTGAKVQSWKAVVGDKLWFESSWHTADYMQAKRAGKDFFEARISEPYNPKAVGQTHVMVFGFAALNPRVIEDFLIHLKLRSDKETVGKIIEAGVKEISDRSARSENRWLTEEEVEGLCRKLAG
jgi:isopropylmalate/homocitrate/citramalate synthase